MSPASVVWRGVAALPLLALQALWVLSTVPVIAKVAPLMMLGLAFRRPGAALVALAGLAPLVGVMGAWIGLPFHGARLFEQLTIGVILGTVASGRRFTGLRTATPGLVLLVIAVSSAIAVMPAWFLADGIQPSLTDLWSLLRNGDLFAVTPIWRPVHMALLTSLGVALACITEQTERARPNLCRWVLMALVAGGTVAATFNLLRVWELASSRGADVLALLGTVRLNTQLDINAAGSLFALLIVGGVGLLSSAGWLRWIAGCAIAVMTVGGLWLSGSRAAMVAAFVATLCAMVVAAVRTRPERRRRVLAGVAIVVLLGAAAVAVYPSTRNFAVSKSIESRLILYRAAVDMWRDAPVMGMGIGTFAERSVDYGSAAIDAILVTGNIKENAHNYFLQVLAELGAVGLIAFVWLLASVLWPALRSRAGPGMNVALWMAAGVVAYLTTALTGHPQLLSEAVLPFWIVLGCLSASTPEPAPLTGAQPAVRRWLAVVATLAMIATLPARTSHLRDFSQLEHRGVGLSLWHTSTDGVQYRRGTNQSTVFVPTGHAIAVSIRLESPASSPAAIDIWLDQTRVNQVTVGSDGWTDLRLTIPLARRRFVDLRLSGQAGTTFWIGRVNARKLE
jgi:hypothetical protein